MSKDVKRFLINKLYKKWLKENKEKIIEDLKEKMFKTDEYLVISPEEAYEYMKDSEIFNKVDNYFDNNVKRLEDIKES
jgi:hypothetical protein